MTSSPPRPLQRSLFDDRPAYMPPKPTAPAIAHSETSREAAAAIQPSLGNLQKRVLLALTGSRDGMTDLELQEHLKMDGSTQRPRRVWLQQHGFVRDSGRKRKTESGRQAVVWEWTGKEMGFQ